MSLTVDILVKTHPPDYPWLKYLFRSMGRVRGYRHLALLLEEQYPLPPGLPPDTVISRSRRYVGTDYPSGLGAVVERLRAWSYTDADFVLYVDSDCVWSRGADLSSDPALWEGGRPVVLWRPWGEPNGTGDCWRAAAERTLGCSAARATMVRYPFCFPRDVLRACWYALGGESRLVSLATRDEIARSAPCLPPTDWHVLGNWALAHASGRVAPRHWSQAGEPLVRHFLSYDGADSPHVVAAMRSMGLA
jgi:hypothetical protein